MTTSGSEETTLLMIGHGFGQPRAALLTRFIGQKHVVVNLITIITTASLILYGVIWVYGTIWAVVVVIGLFAYFIFDKTVTEDFPVNHLILRIVSSKDIWPTSYFFIYLFEKRKLRWNALKYAKKCFVIFCSKLHKIKEIFICCLHV